MPEGIDYSKHCPSCGSIDIGCSTLDARNTECRACLLDLTDAEWKRWVSLRGCASFLARVALEAYPSHEGSPMGLGLVVHEVRGFDRRCRQFLHEAG